MMLSQPTKVLWFCNTPGLAVEHLKGRSFGGGWIDALQTKVEQEDNITLGLVFYADTLINNFTHRKTAYFPVKRVLDTKYKRFAGKLFAKVEYKENVGAFLQIVETFKPDVIHVHGTESSFGLIIEHITKIPVVVSIQGNLIVYSRKYFSGIPQSFIRKSAGRFFNKTMQDYRSFKKRAHIESEILEQTRYVMGRTDWDKRITRVLAPQSKYFQVDEVIRPCFYTSQWSLKRNNTKVLFTTSSNSLYKGFETIVETAMLLKKRCSFEWFVAGLNPHDELVQYAMKLFNISDLGSLGIKLMGPIVAETILEKMLQADLYVQVSHIENSPNSICEAMLLGIPVVATSAGGTSSLVEDKKSGMLVQDGDATALAGTILELFGDSELAVQLGRAAYTSAHHRHDPGKIVGQLSSAYNTIIKDHHENSKQ